MAEQDGEPAQTAKFNQHQSQMSALEMIKAGCLFKQTGFNQRIEKIRGDRARRVIALAELARV